MSFGHKDEVFVGYNLNRGRAIIGKVVILKNALIGSVVKQKKSEFNKINCELLPNPSNHVVQL
jgi:hypothetical protein